jgi:hypothetical protein
MASRYHYEIGVNADRLLLFLVKAVRWRKNYRIKLYTPQYAM